MDEATKQAYIDRMVENLPVLRAKLKLTQKDLAELIGVSHYSISGMEKGQRKMTWNTFMSLLPVFAGNEETNQLLQIFGILTDQLEGFLRAPQIIHLSDEDLELVAAAGVAHPGGHSFGRKQPPKTK